MTFPAYHTHTLTQNKCEGKNPIHFGWQHFFFFVNSICAIRVNLISHKNGYKRIQFITFVSQSGAICFGHFYISACMRVATRAELNAAHIEPLCLNDYDAFISITAISTIIHIFLLFVICANMFLSNFYLIK